MSGRYARTYSRKKPPPPPISQFDRLVSEPGKSAHPVAAKTAGHVGKWGMASFTSLRYINGTYGREDSGKRSWPDSSSVGNEFSSGSDASANGPGNASAPVKRKKFFKSRDESSGVVSPVSRSNSTDWLPSSTCTESPLSKSKPSEVETVARNKSTYGGVAKSQTINASKAKSSSLCSSSVNKPTGGIKLKIFKSRNSESCLQEYSSTVELPSEDSRSSTNSSSVSSSPRLDEERSSFVLSSKVPANGEFASQEPKIPSLTLMRKQAESSINDRSGHFASPNVTLNNSYDASFEFGVLVDQRTGLPISPLNSKDDDSNPASAQSTLSPIKDKGDHCDPKDVNSENIVTKTDNVHSSNDKKEEDKNASKLSDAATPTLETAPKKCEESVCDSSKENTGDDHTSKKECGIDLFSTDFDENEIVDRTSIDYSSSGFTESFNRSDTLDLADLWGTQNSQSGSSVLTRSSSSQLDEERRLKPNAKSTTKRSIFKSRSKDEKSKKRATYIHKWHTHDEKEEDAFKNEGLEKRSSITSSGKSSDDPFEFDTTPELKRVHTWPTTSDEYNVSFDATQSLTSVKCPKEAKKFYTVIKNVKKTHQLQESGEFQEFNDDVEYFLDALKSCNSISTRCLASLNLAQKCMVPAFRMHLRAHGTVTKFFRALSDAPSHPRLSESAAMVMFALSQDRLNMDLDRDSLELMLNLLDTDARPISNNEESMASDASLVDHTSRIKTLCEELKQKGHAKHLKLERIDAAALAMETLLSLTSKRAGEWFKEELRMLGGVDHLIRTVTSCVDHFNASFQSWNSALLEKLTKAERCLKVLENITHQNESNQEYLLKKTDPAFGKTLMRLFRLCHIEIPLNPEKTEGHLAVTPPNPVITKGLITTLTTTIKVLINLTHNPRKEALGSQLLGSEDEIYMISLYCLLIMPEYLNHDTKFEIQVLACCLLLNLVENSVPNRKRLMSMKSPISFQEEEDDEIFKVTDEGSAMQSLVSLFYSSEESAREQEAHTDNIIENDLDKDANKDEEKKDDDIEETVARLLQKAGRHMEDTLIAAYTALLSGFCLMESKEFEDKIRSMQPENDFKTMVAVLKKFFHFMILTATTALLRSLKPTERVLKYMEKLDRSLEKEVVDKKSKDEESHNDKALAFNAFGF